MINNLPSWLYKRPRVLNVLHSLRLASPHSQMNIEEKNCLRKYATDKHMALEIGTYMGVTASLIATSLSDTGKLFCVDPFEEKNNKLNPGFQMALRELKKMNVLYKVKFLLGFSNDKKISYSKFWKFYYRKPRLSGIGL